MTRPQIIVYQAELEDVPANAAEASRTLTMNVVQFRQLAIAATLTHATATSLDMLVKFRAKSGGLLVTQQSVSIAGATGTLSDYNRSKPAAANVDIGLDLPVDAYNDVECIFSAPGGGAADLINAQISAAD